MRDPLQTLESVVEQAVGVRLEACGGERLEQRAKQVAKRHGMAGLRELVAAIQGAGGDDSPLLQTLVAGLLVHETFFYRYGAQLQVLAERVLPSLLASNPPALRLWSAGCSNGAEAYTLGMLALEARARVGSTSRIEVLGTDVCEALVREARAGTYSPRAVESLPETLRARYLEAHDGGRLRASGPLREAVVFQRRNLMDSPPRRDCAIILCRNVLMYLRQDARDRVVEQLAQGLTRDGWLLVGHGDSLRSRPELFTAEGTSSVSMYRLAPGRRARGAGVPAGASVARPREKPIRAAEGAPTATPSPQGLRRVVRVELEGVYDAEHARPRLEALRARLAGLAASGATIEILADGADSLDDATARMLVRASHLATAEGGSVRVHGSRAAVVRWAQRHGVALWEGLSAQRAEDEESTDGAGDGRQG